jgi:mRNA interferase MazF
VIRGAVYRVDLGRPRGHEQGGRRYGVVLSPTDMPWSVATIAPTSTSAQASVFRPELEIAGRTTRVLVDQLRTLDVDHVHGEPVDYLSRDPSAEIEHALAHYLGLVLTTVAD